MMVMMGVRYARTAWQEQREIHTVIHLEEQLGAKLCGCPALGGMLAHWHPYQQNHHDLRCSTKVTHSTPLNWVSDGISSHPASFAWASGNTSPPMRKVIRLQLFWLLPTGTSSSLPKMNIERDPSTSKISPETNFISLTMTHTLWGGGRLRILCCFSSGSCAS